MAIATCLLLLAALVTPATMMGSSFAWVRYHGLKTTRLDAESVAAAATRSSAPSSSVAAAAAAAAAATAPATGSPAPSASGVAATASASPSGTSEATGPATGSPAASASNAATAEATRSPAAATRSASGTAAATRSAEPAAASATRSRSAVPPPPPSSPAAAADSADACDAQLAATVAAVRAWTAAARNVRVPPGCIPGATEYGLEPPPIANPTCDNVRCDAGACDQYAWHGRPMFMGVWERDFPCALLRGGRAGRRAGASGVLVTVAVMDASWSQAGEVAATWGARAASMGARVQFVHGPGVPPPAAQLRGAFEAVGSVVSLSHAQARALATDGSSGGGDGGGDGGDPVATTPLLAMRWVATQQHGRAAAWHAVMPDTAYLSLDEAVALVGVYDPRVPLLVGHVDGGRLISPWRAANTRPFATHPADSSGVLLSAAALGDLAGVLLTPACPWPPASQPLARRWGVALGRCCWAARVPQLHSALFVSSMESIAGKSVHFDRNDAVLEALVAVSPNAGGRYDYVRSDMSVAVNDTLTWVHGRLAHKYNDTAFVTANHGDDLPERHGEMPPETVPEVAPPPSSAGAGACVSAAAAAVRAWARAGRHPQRRRAHYVKTRTLAGLLGVHPCVASTAADTAASHFAIVVMSSSKLRERLEVQQQHWGGSAQAAGARVFYVNDVADAALGVTVLDDAAARNGSYLGAQHRSLRGLQHAVAVAPDARWFFLVDDDTYYDVDEAAALVRRVDHRVAALLGFTFRGMLRFTAIAPMASISGGAGILLSHAAAHAVAGALYTPTCPFYRLNDLTLSRCAYNLGLPLVHHDAFQPDFDGRYIVRDLRVQQSPTELGGSISAHRLVPVYFLVEGIKHLDAVRLPHAAEHPFEWWA